MSSSPGAARRIASRARCTMPSGAWRREPTASFDSGMPNSRTAGTPTSASRRHSSAARSTDSWATPGMLGTGRSTPLPGHHEQWLHELRCRRRASRAPAGGALRSAAAAAGGRRGSDSSPLLALCDRARLCKNARPARRQGRRRVVGRDRPPPTSRPHAPSRPSPARCRRRPARPSARTPSAPTSSTKCRTVELLVNVSASTSTSRRAPRTARASASAGVTAR